MRILHITSKPIFPKVDGGCVAMDNLLKCLLSQNIEIKHLSLSTEKHVFSLSNYPDEIANRINPESVTVKTAVTIKGALLHLIKKGSYNVDRFHSSKMEDKILKELKTNEYDSILLESLFTTSYINEIRKHFKGNIFLRIHNIESDLWDSFHRHEKSFFKRLYIGKLAKDIRKYEFDSFSKMNGILAISDDDKASVLASDSSLNCTTIPVAIEQTDIRNSQSSSDVFHLGSMNWIPNIESVERLIRLFPLIRKQHPKTKLRLAGGNFPKSIKSNTEQGVFIDGFVPDPNQFALESGILVAPIISGSGVRIKILEMMSAGVPVITTTLGALGINTDNSDCLVIADSDEEIIDKTSELIENENLRQNIGRNAIDYIKENHSIEKISNRLIEFIKNT